VRMIPWSRRRLQLVSSAVLLAAVAALITSAVLAQGYPVQQVSLNDGGIWVTSDHDGLFGRLNKPAGALDAAFYPPDTAQATYQLDILQDGAAVAAWDQAAGKLYPVDVNDAVTLPDQAALVPSTDQTQLAGGAIATIDPVTGDVRAQQVDELNGISSLNALDQSSRPLASVGGRVAANGQVGAALAVGVDGTVYAVSSSGKVATIPAGSGGADGASGAGGSGGTSGAAAAGSAGSAGSGSGSLGTPKYSSLGQVVGDVRATAVGDQLIVLDASNGTLIVPGGPTVHLQGVDRSTVLQVPGPQAASVIVATSHALMSVSLSSGAISVLSDIGAGAPAAPVSLDGCVYAAWANTRNGYVSSCGGAKAKSGNLTDLQELVQPEFRQNRGSIVLNDLATGAVWDLSTLREVDDWSSVKPPPVIVPQKQTAQSQSVAGEQNQPPKAVDVTLGARPDRTTVLHVLDGCSDPSGNILSVSAVTAPENPAASVAIAPDGQTVLVTLTAGAVGQTQFKYTIDDGKGLTATATVTVEIRTLGQNSAPNLRAGYTPTVLPVAAGGQISLAVLADWRDFDGDPLALSATSAAAGSAVATTGGLLNYTAPVTAGIQTIHYQVSDGHGGVTDGTTQVDVQSLRATKAVAATAEPVVARGEVGQPVVVSPLDNALPGFDPANPGAQPALAGEVASPAGTTVTTDLTAGTVTVIASRPGTFLLGYTVAFGDAPFAKSTIRVDIAAAPAAPLPPVTMPAVAVLRGQLPDVVDVLADDFDPSGALLTVQQAAAVTSSDPASGQLQAAVIGGRWLRITALSSSVDSTPRLVRYTVTDGITAPVTGEVSVTQLPVSITDTPVPVDAYATVRVGDSVSADVLAQDIDPDGSALTLAQNVPGAPGPGRLQILSQSGTTSGAVGTAYVTGNTIRYVAPAAVASPVTEIVEYLVQNSLGDQAVGHLYATVNPLPSTAFPNRPPDPQPVQARAVAGQSVTIQIPTSAVDPDGDTVAVSGIGSAPTLGRVTSFNATSITYQAFPASAGTDTFAYEVQDAYGAVGSSTVRVAVTPPAAPQPPVAVDDVVTGAPGARLAVGVLGLDLVAPGDAATIEPLAPLNPDLGPEATLASPTGAIDVTVPQATGKPLVVTYAITDGTGDPSTATLTVYSQQGYETPPVARDTYANPAPHATTVTVNALAQCSDPDASQNDLVISKAFDPSVKIVGGKLVLPVGTDPRTYAYEVKAPSGASTVGVVHVAAPSAGAPYAKLGQLITLPANGSTTIDIASYVIDPAGKTVRLTTTNEVWSAPAADLSAVTVGEGQIKLTGLAGYVGPAALTFQVTDGASLTDPAGLFAIITIPVQVGPEVPVLRCPTDPLSAVEGGTPRTFDVTSVCYVWTANPAAAAGLDYTATWFGAAPAGVSVSGSGSHILTVTADAASVPGSTGNLQIAVAGSPGDKSQLPVVVTAAAPPSISPITVDGVKAGQTATVNLASYVTSELIDPAISVVSVTQTSGMAATASSDGAVVSITPGGAAHGLMTFNVRVTDVPSRTRTDRQTTGQITLNVLGMPDAPGQPTLGNTVLSRAVQLSWPTPADNGAPIDSYQVTYPGGQQTCPASPCTITGLTNGKSYTFTVKAHNLVGWGQPSPASAAAEPNTIPDAVAGLTVSDPQNGTLALKWTAAEDQGTPVLHYSVSWTGGGQESATGTSLTANGLANDTQYTFTVIAVNSQGPGPATTVSGQSAGAPPAPDAPDFTAVDSADANSRAVTVSWNAVDSNGPGPSTYTLTRTGGGADKTVCAAVTATSCDDDGLANNGTVYTYSVTAANADVSLDPAKHTSPASPGTRMTATATPDPITGMSATATGNNGQAEVAFNAPPSHGATSTVTCTYGGGNCGTWTFGTAGQNGVDETINGLPNGDAETISLQDCNGSAGGQDAGTACDTAAHAGVTAYGPMQNLDITASASGQTVNFTVSVDPNGKAATVSVRTSKQTQTFTTGVGRWTWSSSDDMGYGATDTINVTVSDSGRTTLTGSKSVSTAAKPSVAISRGALCGYGGEPTCVGSGSCSNAQCGYVHIVTTGFTGSYSCDFNSAEGDLGNQTFSGDVDEDSVFYYGYPGTTFTVTCNGVADSYTWP
jgi:hypothetical protein